MLRTCLDGVEKVGEKFSVKFKTFRVVNRATGEEYEAFEAKSSPVFATEDEAYAGGKRALDMLEATGRYPNMCAPF